MGNKMAEALSALSRTYEEVIPGIIVLRLTVVNAVMVESQDDSGWALVDTGLENSARFIKKVAEKRFGKNSKPRAIILTHGHFDHVGSVKSLAEEWDVPVYIHPLELPYITGEKDYPLADPSVGSGLIARLSTGFPHSAIDLGMRAVELPADASIPGLPGWSWVHTPGHTEGHVSLFHGRDLVLLAGDAFTTTKQESLFSVLTQKTEISGPPAYLTTDWKAAGDSIRLLRDLKPTLVIPSHGPLLEGSQLEKGLEFLTANFKDMAVPEQGRYVD